MLRFDTIVGDIPYLLLGIPLTLGITAVAFVVGILIARSEEHTSELQSQSNLVCRLLLEKKKKHDSSPAGTLFEAELNSDRTNPFRLSLHLLNHRRQSLDRPAPTISTDRTRPHASASHT